MNCPTERGAPEVLLDYCAGRLSADAAREFEEHLAACGCCRETAAGQQAVWSALDGWEPVPVSADFDRRLYARIARDEAGRGWWSMRVVSISARLLPFNWRPALPAVAACAAMGLALMIQSPAPDRALPVSDPQVRAEHLDLEQVESALDDLDMLKKIGAVSDASASM
jgi:anti-sigma factor RsiW